MKFSNSLKSKLGAAALLGGGALVVGGGLFLVIVVGFVIFALTSAIAAVVLWLIWNYFAPTIDAIPTAYQQVDFLLTWGVVMVLRLLGGIIFGRRNQ